MRPSVPTKYEGKLFIVSHLHETKDLRKYSETAGDWECECSGPVAAFDTQEQAEAFVEEQVTKIVGNQSDKWNRADIVQGGRHFGRSARRGVKLTRRGARHEFVWSTLEYFPLPAQKSEPPAGVLAGAV